MKYRNFPQLNRPVSEIGIGCWQLGGDFGSMEESTAVAILEEAVASGITFFDTADVYGGGRSEKILGSFLNRKGREDFIITTKVGRTGDLFPDSYTREGLRARVEDCLRHLDTEYIDLIQLHCIPLKYLEDNAVFDWLRELKQEGKIKAFGASVATVEEGLVAMRQEDLASLQVIFNVFRQKVREELLPVAREKNVGIIVRLPLNSGLLSGKMSAETVFEEGDHRNYNRDGAAFSVGETFGGIPFEKGLELVEALREMVPEGYSFADFAQRFLLDHPEVTTLITGASKVHHPGLNAAVSELAPLPEDLHRRLHTFYAEQVAGHIRGFQ